MSEKKDKPGIKDYLPLYLKCWGTLTRKDKEYYHKYYEDGDWILSGTLYQEIMMYGHEFKAHLRQLSDITEEEVKILDKEVWGIIEDSEMAIVEYKEMLLSPWPTESRPGFPVYVKTINCLRKMGFDCDELIESGLAIDKTKL